MSEIITFISITLTTTTTIPTIPITATITIFIPILIQLVWGGAQWHFFKPPLWLRW